ncbi:V-set and transmembrane domain-containing protein 2A-like [Anguilla rostrata]|uniref:V-set and transmembrane domain-containing protein 2A-like n=1 Tax=Anguilla rostrata TaxID=7938 RepID=UPI0030D5666A
MMRTLQEFIGFVFCSSFYIQLGYSFEGRFTEQPSNITAKEGENIEMGCAFKSGTPSVYLEIQWWFLRAAEERDYEENTDLQVDTTPESDPDYEGIKISTVRVHGNDISHRLHISKVGQTDEGRYECRVTSAYYAELLEYKALAYLRVTRPARPRGGRPLNKTSPLHLTDKKPRKGGGGGSGPPHASPGSQRLGPTSRPQTTPASARKHSPASGTKITTSHGFAVLLVVYGVMKGAFL